MPKKTKKAAKKESAPPVTATSKTRVVKVGPGKYEERSA